MSGLGGLLGLGEDILAGIEALEASKSSAASASPSVAAKPVSTFTLASIGGHAITVATAEQGLQAIPDILAAFKTGLSSLSADEAAATDIANIAVAIDPALAVPVDIGEFVLPWVIASVQAVASGTGMVTAADPVTHEWRGR